MYIRNCVGWVGAFLYPPSLIATLLLLLLLQKFATNLHIKAALIYTPPIRNVYNVCMLVMVQTKVPLFTFNIVLKPQKYNIMCNYMLLAYYSLAHRNLVGYFFFYSSFLLHIVILVCSLETG